MARKQCNTVLERQKRRNNLPPTMCVCSVYCGHRSSRGCLWAGQWHGWHHAEPPTREHVGRRWWWGTATRGDRHVDCEAWTSELCGAWRCICIQPHRVLAGHQPSHPAGKCRRLHFRQESVSKNHQNKTGGISVVGRLWKHLCLLMMRKRVTCSRVRVQWRSLQMSPPRAASFQELRDNPQVREQTTDQIFPLFISQ